jgi:hypothetical protein
MQQGLDCHEWRGCVTVSVEYCGLLIMEVQVRCQDSPCGICVGWSGTEAGFSQNT